MKSKNRTASTLYSLGTYVCVRNISINPCIKEMMMIIIIIIIITTIMQLFTYLNRCLILNFRNFKLVYDHRLQICFKMCRIS